MLEKPIREMTMREKAARAYRLLSEDEAVRGQARAARTLLEKLEDQDMTVAVVGQFKRGKSALSNRILGEDVLPVGIVPITSAVTRVKYGERRAEVRYENGICEEIPESDLHRFISEQENRNNELGVAEVVLQAPSGFLKSGLTFVDTPGVGSFHKNNTEVAYDHMKESDAVIFLLSVDSPINQIEIDFLRNTRNFAARFYFAVNKVDTVSPAELGEYLKYCESVLEQLMGEKEIRIFPVSARTGEGVEELKAVIQADLGAQARSIMEMSTAKKLIDVIDRAVEQLDFYWKAMNMEYKELDRRFEEIEKTMTDIRTRAAACEGGFHLHLNEYKMELSRRVKELFGMEYHYDIDMLKLGILDMDRQTFVQKTEELCSDLKQTLDRILLYREENAYTVCHRINAINRLLRELRRIRDSLAQDLRQT